MKLAVAEKMRQIDARAINEFGIPGVVLMENAGKGTVDLIFSRFGTLKGKRVVIFVGPGNNGGDGFVIARHLHQLDALLSVYLTVAPENIKGDAAINYRILEKLPVPVHTILDDADVNRARSDAIHADIIVDAIFGTGLTRKLKGRFAGVVGLINESRAPVVAVDIASGLDSDSGQPLGSCVHATITATYGLAKPGQMIFPGADLGGELHVIDIGIPPQIINEAGINTQLLEKTTIASMLPERKVDSHKGSHGHILLVAGSEGKTGAAILAANGAMRSGSGLVSLCVPKKLNVIFENSLVEAMTIPVGSNTAFSAGDYPLIQQALSGKKACLIGPGIGTDAETAKLVNTLYQEAELPIVIDADGLNSLEEILPARKHGSVECVFTPHPGEMARLMGVSTKEVQKNRMQVASEFAVEKGVVLVLKGAATIIAGPDGRVAVNPTGNPAMATGGMGDVLAGVITCMLGQGVSAWQAACIGAYVHGLAADRLALNNKINFGIYASDVANELPLAFKEIISAL